MTEAYRPTEAQTPRASGVNRTDMFSGRRIDRKGTTAAAATLAVLTAAGAGAQSPQPSFEPGFSPLPSPSDVLVGRACPTPLASPSPSPEATTLIGQAPLSDGRIVTVSLAQELPSPSTQASQGTETALNPDCLEHPTAGERFNEIINQPDENIRRVKLSALKKAIFGSTNRKGERVPGFWDKYSQELEQMDILLWAPGQTLSKRVLEEELSIIEGTFPGMPNDEREKALAQLTEVGTLSVMFLAMSERSENPQLIADSQKLADQTFDHGVKGGIHQDQDYAKSTIVDNMRLNGPKLFRITPPSSQG
jgi:hypothetical protein